MTTEERVERMTFASVYPHYVAKVDKKGRTLEELHEVITWLTIPIALMIKGFWLYL